MMRVVDRCLGKEKMETLGLTEKNIRVDPDVYRHYVEQFRVQFSEFIQKRRGNSPPPESGDPPVGHPPEERIAAADAGLLDAFEECQAPFSYYRGRIYRYRVDRFGDADGPIILESLERSEITGDSGIYGFNARKGLFMSIARRIDKWLTKRQEKG